MKTGPVPVPVSVRLARRSAPAETGDCIYFTGALVRGYGYIHNGAKQAQAHRVAYELACGPIPPGLELDHICHTRDLSCEGGVSCLHRRCINPDHLNPIGVSEHRALTTHRKTRCERGHVLDAANTYWSPNGKRRSCRACHRLRDRRFKAKRKEATT